MGDPVTLTIAAIGTQLGSSVVAAKKQREAAKAQRRATAIERRSAQIQNISARRKAVRQSIIQQQQAVARAGAQGGAEVAASSSRVLGQVSELQTQLGSNLGLQTTLEDLNNARLRQLDSAAKISLRAQEISQAGQAISSAFGSVASVS